MGRQVDKVSVKHGCVCASSREAKKGVDCITHLARGSQPMSLRSSPPAPAPALPWPTLTTSPTVAASLWGVVRGWLCQSVKRACVVVMGCC